MTESGRSLVWRLEEFGISTGPSIAEPGTELIQPESGDDVEL